MNNGQFDKLLKSALKRSAKAPADEAAVNRVLQPDQRTAATAEATVLAPARILLDWQFAPAWPRMAALASCAVLGFFVGLAGHDPALRIRRAAPANVGGGVIGSITFEPEAFAGAHP